jgi:hypothetical protein
MKKVLLMNIFPVGVGYSVFTILLAIFSKIPKYGQQILNIWYIPFMIVTIYMCYTIFKDFRTIKQNN